MTTLVADWPDRHTESLLLPDDDQTLRLIYTFEEYLYDDSSASEWTCTSMQTGTGDSYLPEHICSYTMQYDGISNRELVFNSWQLLKDRAILRDIVDWIRSQPSADHSLRDYLRRQQSLQLASGILPGRRQRVSAARRQAEVATVQPFRIQWDDTRWWHTPSGSYLIVETDDAFLWHTVIWLVRNQITLSRSYSSDNVPVNATPALVAAAWLRVQPVFRAMLKESIRRDFTFPSDVFNYCRRYVLDGTNTLDGYQPWHDPGQTEQPKELAALLNAPDVPPEIRLNKDLRVIVL